MEMGVMYGQGNDSDNRPHGGFRAVEDKATDDDCTWGTFVHLAGLSWVVFPLGGILGPLVLWLIKKDNSEFLDDHGREAVNFQISMMLYTIASIALFLCGIGILLLPVVVVLAFVMPIVMAIKANRGEYVRYPVTIRFISPTLGA